MKSKIITFLTLFLLLSFNSDAQKEPIFFLIKDSVHILKNDLLDISPQSYEFEAFKGDPQLGLPDMFYFNAYDEWKNSSSSRLTFYEYARNQKMNVLGWLAFRFDFKEIQENTFHPEKYFQPFYFRKYEVTNGEYREFVEWVIDSLAHDIIGNFYESQGEQYIDWTTEIDWTDETLDEMYTIDSFDFNPKKEIDKDILIYTCKDETGQWYDVPVYPAPMISIRYEYNEPDRSLYFSHPALDNNPVVNINYHQAMAFCDWKTARLKEKFHALQLPYDIEVSLPKAYEWQWIAWHTGDNMYFRLEDTKWQTSLVTKTKKTDAFHLEHTYHVDSRFGLGDFTFPTGYSSDNEKQFLALKKKLSFEEEYTKKLIVDANGVYCMANNVSEWMQDNYTDNWQPAFSKYIEHLNAQNDKSSDLLRQLQLYYDEQNDKNGQLVYGGNWLYPSEQFVGSKNVKGLFEKTFVSPDEAHSTIGFRYVIRIKKKNL